MIKFLIFICTIVCKPGIVYTLPGEVGSELPTTILQGEKENDSTYYYYDLEFNNGVYLYVSDSKKDSVWFYVEEGLFYDSSNPSVNEEFEVQN